MEVNRQLLATILGISIVVFHVIFCFVLWFVFNPKFDVNGEILVAEFSTPLSAAFALGVVKWVIDTKGKITSAETVGFAYAFLIGFVAASLFLALAYGPYTYSQPESLMTPASLNTYFLVVESILGGMFGLFFNDMFGRADASNNISRE